MPTSDTALLLLLKAFEAELHKPAARSDATRLDALLHDDFREFGCSGAAYTKADILSRLPAEVRQGVVVADRFEVRRLGEATALLTYRSTQLLADGTLDRFALRASLWEHSARGWQMSFHQGTPTTPYAPEPLASAAG